MNTSRKMTEKEVGWFLDVKRVLNELGSNIDVEGAFRYLDNTIDILQLNVADSPNNPSTLLIMVTLEDKRTVMRVNRKGTDILDFYISPDYNDEHVRELVGEIDRRCRFILNLYEFVVSNAPARYAGSKTYHEFRTDSTRVIYSYSTSPEIGTLRVVEGATTYVLANIAHGSVLNHKIVVGPWMEEICHDIERVEDTNEEAERYAETAKEVCLPEPEMIRVSDPFTDLEKAIESGKQDTEMYVALAMASCELLRLYVNTNENGSVSYRKDSIRFEYINKEGYEVIALYGTDGSLLFRSDRRVGGAWGFFYTDRPNDMAVTCQSVQGIVRSLRGPAYPYGIRDVEGRTALVGYGFEPTRYADEFVQDFIDRNGAEHFLQWVCEERKRATKESYHVIAYLNCEVSVQVYSYHEQATIKGTV